jgi:hypothetical protein
MWRGDRIRVKIPTRLFESFRFVGCRGYLDSTMADSWIGLSETQTELWMRSPSRSSVRSMSTMASRVWSPPDSEPDSTCADRRNFTKTQNHVLASVLLTTARLVSWHQKTVGMYWMNSSPSGCFRQPHIHMWCSAAQEIACPEVWKPYFQRQQGTKHWSSAESHPPMTWLETKWNPSISIWYTRSA